MEMRATNRSIIDTIMDRSHGPCELLPELESVVLEC